MNKKIDNNIGVWETVIENTFFNKRSLIFEIKRFSKISSYDENKYILKLRVFKVYIEKLLSNNINDIKKEYEKTTNKPIEKIYVNNRVFVFGKVYDTSKDLEKTRVIDEFKISFDAIKDDDVYRRDISLKDYVIEPEKEIKLTFYNELLFFTKNIEIDLTKFFYGKNLKKSLIGFLLIFPGIFFLIKFLIQKRYVKRKKEEINSLVSLKYKPLNKKTQKIFEEYIMDKI